MEKLLRRPVKVLYGPFCYSGVAEVIYMYYETNVQVWYLYSIHISSFIATGDSIRWQTGSPDIKGLVPLIQISEKDKGLCYKYDTQSADELGYFYILY